MAHDGQLREVAYASLHPLRVPAQCLLTCQLPSALVADGRLREEPGFSSLTCQVTSACNPTIPNSTQPGKTAGAPVYTELLSLLLHKSVSPHGEQGVYIPGHLPESLDRER